MMVRSVQWILCRSVTSKIDCDSDHPLIPSRLALSATLHLSFFDSNTIYDRIQHDICWLCRISKQRHFWLLTTVPGRLFGAIIRV